MYIHHEIGDLCSIHKFAYGRDNVTGGQKLHVYDKDDNYLGCYRMTDYLAELMY